MLWLKDDKEEKVVLYSLKGDIETLTKLKHDIERKRKHLGLCGLQERNNLTLSKPGLEAQFCQAETIISYNPCYYSYSIINSIINNKGSKSVELDKLIPEFDTSFISGVISNLDSNYVSSLLDKLCPDFVFFATSLFKELEMVKEREVLIKSLKKIRELATEVGIDFLGNEYKDLVYYSELAKRNSNVLSLVDTVNKKLR